MYGKLGWKPWELSRTSFKDVSLALTGLHKKEEDMYGLFSRLGLVVAHAGFNTKGAVPTYKKAFPVLTVGKQIQKESRALKQLERFREIEAVKRANAKTNG